MEREQVLYNKQCREFTNEMMQFIGDRPLRFWEVMASQIAAKIAMLEAAAGVAKPNNTPPAQPAAKPARREVASSSKDVEDALELCDTIDELADEVPEAGLEFADSVRTKAKDIAATIERNDRVSSAQVKALENFERGLRAWIHD